MSERPSHDIQQIWHSQEPEEWTMSVEQLRTHSQGFQRRVRMRNLREYVAAALVVFVFGAYTVFLPSPLMKGGAVLVILAVLYVSWQLHSRASARAIVGDESVMDFHRRELTRQRDALRSIARWYLAPFLPGLGLFLYGAAKVAPGDKGWAVLASGAVCLAVFFVVWLMNRKGAARLQREIDSMGRE